MKKWLWLLIVVFVIGIGLSFNVYLNALKPVKAAEKIAEEIAKRETSLVTLTDFSLYNGSSTYYVIKGIDQEGENIVVWVPENEGKIIVKKENEGITKKEALQKLYNEKNPEEVMAVRLGIENNIPLWEIYYRTGKNLINYYYVDFSTGEWLKDIQNL